MKKFAVFAAALLLLVPVFCFAGSAKLLTDDSVYKFAGITFGQVFPEQSSNSNADYVWSKIEVVSSGSVVKTFYSCSFKMVYSDSPSYPPFGYLIGGVKYGLSDLGFDYATWNSATYNFYGLDSTFVFNGSSAVVSGVAVTVDPVFPSLSDSVFSVGSSLLAFVTANWLTLVALGSFLLVLCIGAIRRLVKGV